MDVNIVNEKEATGRGGRLNAEDQEEEKDMMWSSWLRCLENSILQVEKEGKFAGEVVDKFTLKS